MALERYPEVEAQYELHETLGAGERLYFITFILVFDLKMELPVDFSLAFHVSYCARV